MNAGMKAYGAPDQVILIHQLILAQLVLPVAFWLRRLRRRIQMSLV